MTVSLRCKSVRKLVLPLSLLLAFPAHAHVGVGAAHGWAHGALHPLLGADHLAAMVAVGLLAGQSGGRARWLLPLTFVAVMALGGMLGMAALPLPAPFSGGVAGGMESGILASLLVLGALVAAAVRLPLAASLPLVGLFALCHGYAHGAEMPHDASGLRYALGFMFSSAALHLAGLTVAGALLRAHRPHWLRIVGGLVAAFGGALCVVG